MLPPSWTRLSILPLAEYPQLAPCKMSACYKFWDWKKGIKGEDVERRQDASLHMALKTASG